MTTDTYKLNLSILCEQQTINISTYTCISVFDKLKWHTIGPKSFLFGTAHAVLSLGQMVQLIILSLTALTLC